MKPDNSASLSRAAEGLAEGVSANLSTTIFPVAPWNSTDNAEFRLHNNAPSQTKHGAHVVVVVVVVVPLPQARVHVTTAHERNSE